LILNPKGQADNDYMKIKKKLYSFVYKEYYYELLLFIQPKEGLKLLQVESNQGVIDFPPFLEDFVDQEVTESKKYRSINLAKITQE
jgi:CYTH domain-containing protein